MGTFQSQYNFIVITRPAHLIKPHVINIFRYLLSKRKIFVIRILHKSMDFKKIYFLQKYGESKINTVNNSNLPSNIAKDKIHLAMSGNGK